MRDLISIRLRIARKALSLGIFLLASLAFGESYGPFQAVTWHGCYDGDTCRVTIPGLHSLLGEKIPIRIRGIDTPEIRGKCEAEKTKA